LNHKTVTHGIIWKVLGSSAGNIVVLLSRDLLKPVFIANCIAIPLGYKAMNNWLNNFAYRMAAFITFLIALFTVSFEALKAGLANPTESLRSE
jgi:putative ABC transport system permease protein